MKQFTAEYVKRGQYCGRGVCMADTIEELIKILLNRGYKFSFGEKENVLDWSKTDKKRYYGVCLVINRGEREMTEYTSF